MFIMYLKSDGSKVSKGFFLESIILNIFFKHAYLGL